MDGTWAKPIVVVSKCLGFAACRYNGLMIPNDFVDRLGRYVEYRTVCPEVEIGLGIPRSPVRIVEHQGQRRLLQLESQRDVTERMTAFADRFLGALSGIDGFILKERSPSCGIGNVKCYGSTEKQAPTGKTAGFFGRAVQERFPNLAVEDEGRLNNFRLREHFLTKLFTLAAFRAVESDPSADRLVRFHASNKLLFMGYHQTEMRVLGRVVAAAGKRPLAGVMADYRAGLGRLLDKPARYTSHVNVLMHAMGYYSDTLAAGEKRFFLETLERYRKGKVPLSVPVGLMQSWNVRFGNEYLGSQTFFKPYPETLVDIADSGKGRDIGG